MADALVKDEFDGNTRIRAGQDGSEGLLLFDSVPLQNGKIVVMSSRFPAVNRLLPSNNSAKAASGVSVL